jgi:hypothetical protein
VAIVRNGYGGGTFSVGDIDVQLVSDGEFHYPVEAYFVGASADELDQALRGQLDEQGLYPSPYTCAVIRAGGRVALVDGGLGEHAAEMGNTAGKLRDSLERIGVGPPLRHEGRGSDVAAANVEATAARLETPSFSNTRDKRFSTVFSEMNRTSAI